MRIYKGLACLFFGMLFGFFSQVGFDSHFGGNNDEVLRLRTLMEEGDSIVAYIDSSFVETNVKIKGIEINLIEVNYSFLLSDKTYSNRFIINDLDSLKSDSILVFYNKANPVINDVNIHLQLQKLDSNIATNQDLYWALGFVSISFVLVFIGLRLLIKGIKEVREALS